MAGVAAAHVNEPAAPQRPNLLVMDRLSGDWRVTRLGSGWRVRVDSLDLVKGERLASLTLDTRGMLGGV